MSETEWGQLRPCESYGRVGDVREDCVVVPYSQALSDTYKDHKHACHTMMLARDPAVLWNLYPTRAAVLMQMRSDGVLGFPGGFRDPGEGPVVAANREMVEEMNLDLTKHSVTNDNHIVSFFNAKKSLVLHFYGLEVTLDEFRAIELAHLQAPDYGSETFGVLRPPLFTMGDNFRGLPAFLSNKFSGNAREELLHGLLYFKVLSPDEIEKALASRNEYEEKNRGCVGDADPSNRVCRIHSK